MENLSTDINALVEKKVKEELDKYKASQAKKENSMTIIVSKGTLDWGYPPFILASTAVAMDYKVTLFFTFYGLSLLKKKISADVSPLGNPAMPMKMPWGPQWFKSIGWNIPNIVQANVPGYETFATIAMKQTIKNTGVATLEELRTVCLESGVKMIGCQMTIDLFGYKNSDFIDGITCGGAAAWLDSASKSSINLFT